MNDRKSALLSAIIKEHVETGNTVASKTIVDNHNFKLSPATIRNEMVVLEKEGFIYQPYTSAGRIPTEKGWKFYIENFLKDIELSNKQKGFLEGLLKEKGLTKESVVKKVAKGLAELSKDAVFIGFSPDNFYYTGLSNLFRQPEFQKIDLVQHISEVVDHLDEVVKNIFKQIKEYDGAKILIGEENPFGKDCSSIVTSYCLEGEETGVIGVLGPMRMNYEDNQAMMKYIKKLFSNL
ncbi:MAG: hypothetical protein WCV50_03050 [Patescibacteria group bacterium]|jgi:heat-inducible transcriptional repressor